MSLDVRSLAVVALTLIGCSDSEGGPSAIPLPPISFAPFTTETTWVPVHGQVIEKRNSGEPDVREMMLAEGLGDEMQAPGEAYTPRSEDGTIPTPGPNARMLLRFAHMADLQLADDESPARVAILDSVGDLGGAYRPQDAYMCHLILAMVRTFNAVNEQTPLSFVMLGGDNADNAQKNELEWVLGLLSGGQIECDSGEDDDLIPGPNNDPKDPLISPGLAMPWYWVMGNHDVLVQGNLRIDGYEDRAVGTKATFGTRDWRLPGGPIVKGDVPADPERDLLSSSEVLARVRDDGDGHGIPEAQVAGGQANYVVDIEGTPLRFLVVDTALELGGAEGAILRADLEGTILPLLDESAAMEKLVIVVSHHSPLSFQSLTTKPEFVTPEEWTALLTSHPAVLFTLVGHSHVNRVELLPGDRPTWMVYTAAVADYPHQSRILEIWDEDNGFVRVHTMTIDFSSEGDPIAAEGRRLGTLDYVSGWGISDGRGEVEDRNVDIYIPKLY